MASLGIWVSFISFFKSFALVYEVLDSEIRIKAVLQAPVVSRKDPKKLLGIVTLHDIARQQNAIEETMERD